MCVCVCVCVMWYTHWCLDHVWSLCSEVFDCVEHINQSLTLHPLNGCTQGTECSSAANTSTTMEAVQYSEVYIIYKQVSIMHYTTYVCVSICK